MASTVVESKPPDRRTTAAGLRCMGRRIVGVWSDVKPGRVRPAAPFGIVGMDRLTPMAIEGGILPRARVITISLRARARGASRRWMRSGARGSAMRCLHTMVVLVSCGWACRPPLQQTHEPAAVAALTQVVTEAPLRRTLVHRQLVAANVEAAQSVAATQVAGLLAELLVEVGQVVGPGQAIARLDVRAAELAVREAQATLLEQHAKVELALCQCARLLALQGQSPALHRGDELADARRRLRAARAIAALRLAQLKRARLARLQHTVVAPQGGVVRGVEVAVGNYLSLGTAVAQV
ncbi:MAG: biotin/lipoyl-binding protein, partial [Deltaproteobacteria bacterium]